MLRKLTSFSAHQLNKTLWSSLFNMLKCHVQIRDAVGKWNDDHVDSLIPSAAQNKQVERLVEIMV